MSIEVRGITKSFGGAPALRDVSLRVEGGELLALLGPSGCGKTTLLRVIAGLETPDAGRVLFEGDDATERKVGERRVGFVFQHYALFRHMTVFENVAFGLTVRPKALRPPKEEIAERVSTLLGLVQMGNMAGRYPSQLSGGQRQRVALARALAVEPKVLLLDEPFGALDAKVRRELRDWLRRLHDEIHVTTVFVTHDQEEALEVSDRIVVMNQGRIEQIGTPDEIFHAPATEFVMAFLGAVNFFHGRVEEGRTVLAAPGPEGPAARAFVRPHELDILRAPEREPSLPAVVRRIHSAAANAKIELAGEDGRTILAEISHERLRALALTVGERVYVSPREVKVFAPEYAI